MAIEYNLIKESIVFKAQDIAVSEQTNDIIRDPSDMSTSEQSNDILFNDISKDPSDMSTLEQSNNVLNDISNVFNTVTTNIQDMMLMSNKEPINVISMPEFNNLFPKSLDSSGYVILSAIALFFSMIILLFIAKLSKAVTTSQKNIEILTDITIALHLQQQSIEYRFLLEEMNSAETSIQKSNARIQLYNYLNRICREICETKNRYLALQLAVAFFSRIHARYIKVNPLPEGVLYFKYIGKILQDFQGSNLSEEELLHKIVSGYKKNIRELQETTRESLGVEGESDKKRNVFSFFRKK